MYEPTCILMWDNGDLGCDPDLGEGCIMSFTDRKYAKGYLRLCKQRASLRIVQMAADRIRHMVSVTPVVWAVSVVYDMGPKSWLNDKIARQIHKLTIKRQPFLDKETPK